ncbi:MAG: hypothetical protein IJU64_00080 [Bacilli bacterium]|nr:hypothetical protein [Bacilli bacterium]
MKKPTLFRLICSCVAAASLITAFIMFALSFIHIDLILGQGDITGFDLAFDFDHDFTPQGSNAGTFIAWLLLLLLALGVLLGAVIEMLVYFGKFKSSKAKINLKQALISEGCTLAVAITIALLIFFTIPMAGYNGQIVSKVGSLGIGAILSGVFVLVGTVIGCIGNLYEFLAKK